MKTAGTFIALMFSATLAWAGDVTTQDSTLGRLVGQVHGELPSGFMEGMKHDVRIEWMKNAGPLKLPACDGKGTAETYGKTSISGKSAVIRLHPGFMKANDESYPCGHRTLSRLARATLIHELAHVWDKGLGLSSSEDFRSAFFRTVDSGDLKNRNFLRSPDTYEFVSAQEQLAVNFEYYVMDTEYACRRPMGQRYFDSVLGRRSSRNCSRRLELRSHYGRDLSFDYDSVGRVDYLLSSKGDGAGSGFGHSMMLIVICKGVVAADCEIDRTKSVVVSFQAAISTPTLSTVKGITGEYPSQVFPYSYSEIVDDVVHKELRDLAAWPLRLEREDIDAFLDAVKQTVWEYQGSYKFLANNCATETLHLLRSSFSRLSGELKSKGLFATPYGVQRILGRSGLLTSDAPSLTDSVLSAKEELVSAFQRLQQAGLFGAELTFKDFSTPEGKKVMINHSGEPAGKDLVKLLLLKVTQLDRKMNSMKGLWLSKNPASRASSLYQQLLKISDENSTRNSAKGGYGVPTVREVIKQHGGLNGIRSIQSALEEEYLKQVPGLMETRAEREKTAAMVRTLALKM